MSGDPGKRPSPEREERAVLASTLLRKAVAADLADPLPLPALPALVRHALRAGAPVTADCARECLILAYAYAELGIEAQVRVAELVVTDAKAGTRAVHGSPRPPRSGDSGHTVLWLPEHRHLIDPGAERYREIAAWKAGPVIAAAGRAGDPAAGEDEITLTVTRGYLRLAYTLGSRAASAGVPGHPAAREAPDGTRLRGVNTASEVIWLLATQRPAAETAVIPYPRAAALIGAVRGMDRHGAAGEDVFFERRAGELAAAGPIRLHQIPLPAGIPASAAVG